MDSNFSNASSSGIDSILNAGISRRGGVKVRGGRLPPIRMRNVVKLTSNKKSIAPKIPQRRVKVKEEYPDYSGESNRPRVKEECQQQEKSGGRGRGRGARVYIQTEGSFLGEGPARKAKNELSELYERGPRTSSKGSGSRTKKEADVKIEESTINELLGYYNEKDAFLDPGNTIRPVRLPFVKMERKLQIKEEIIDNEDIKPKIKEEPLEPSEDKWGALEGKFFSRIKKEDNTEFKVNPLLQDMKGSQSEDRLILIQMPSCLPMGNSFEEVKQKIKKEKEETTDEKKEHGGLKVKDEISGNSIKDIDSGFLGKLQFMKSGEMRLVLGSVVMSLESGTDSETSLEAVSIPIDKGEGDLMVLGKVDKKFILHPELDSLMVEHNSESDVCTRMEKLSSKFSNYY